jgi:hypothetical protein
MKLRSLLVSAILMATVAVAPPVVGTAAGSTRAGHTTAAAAAQQASANGTQYLWNLSDVSCGTADSCEAVGTVTKEPALDPGINFSFAEHWNGQRWRLQRIVNPSDETFLGSISCWSDSGCIAVGGYERGSASYLLAERWDGRAWSLLKPVPVAGASSFGAISCQSAWQCTASGERLNAAETEWIPLTERWNGYRWTSVATPYKSINPSGGWGPLACPTAGECLVLGPNVEAVVRLVDSSWLSRPAPSLPHGRTIKLEDISCAATSFCIAVGGVYIPGRNVKLPMYHHFLPLVERWNGRSWSRIKLPSSAYKRLLDLESVSCPSTTYCVATGWPKHGSRSLVLTAGAWQTAPAPSSITGVVVFCPVAGICVATGDARGGVTRKSSSARGSLVSVLTHGRWRRMRTPLPRFSTGLLAQ